MDRSRSHFSTEISSIFEKYELKFVLISPGLTNVLQPLDTHVNKPFKANLRTEYHKWLLKNKEETITDFDILDFIFNTWYKVEQINKKNIIKNSFRDTGITLNTDGSEDANCLKMPKEFIEEMKLEDNIKDNNINYENFEMDERN